LSGKTRDSFDSLAHLEMQDLSILLSLIQEELDDDINLETKRRGALIRKLSQADKSIFVHELVDPGDEEDLWEIACDPEWKRYSMKELLQIWPRVSRKQNEVTCPLCPFLYRNI